MRKERQDGAESKAFQKANGSAFCYVILQDNKKSKRKSPQRGKKEYDKKRIVEILVFGVCIQLRRIVLRGVQILLTRTIKKGLSQKLFRKRMAQPFAM